LLMARVAGLPGANRTCPSDDLPWGTVARRFTGGRQVAATTPSALVLPPARLFFESVARVGPVHYKLVSTAALRVFSFAVGCPR
jgi:hypothetical protein